jgi:hypothetical protein
MNARKARNEMLWKMVSRAKELVDGVGEDAFVWYR